MIVLPEETKITKLREQDGCVVIEFKKITRFTLVSMEDVKLELVPLFGSTDYKFIFNFEGFDFIDSTGIGCMILLSKTSMRHKSKMKICGLCPKLQDLLEMLRIPMILEIEKDVESCIKKYKEEEVSQE